MVSWQSKLVKLYIRAHFLFDSSDNGSNFDFEKERIKMEAQAARFKVAPDLQCEAVVVAGIPAEWVAAPGALAERVILYLHGGAYAFGSTNTHRALVGRITRVAQARALVLDYRLAPEHKFPAAVEDATAAYRWLLNEGFDPAQIVFAGDSAGGGLTLATLVALRDTGDPLPAAAVCLSPWTDLAGTGESLLTKAKADPWLKPDLLQPTARLYLGDTDPRAPLASPLYADLTGLPPLLIQVGTDEIILSDSTRVAERAAAAGVDVTLEVWPGMSHVWQIFAGFVPEARNAIDNIGVFMRQTTSRRFETTISNLQSPLSP